MVSSDTLTMCFAECCFVDQIFPKLNGGQKKKKKVFKLLEPVWGQKTQWKRQEKQSVYIAAESCG